jgi:hypothetical protein
MSGIVIPAEELTRRRAERERQRQEREALVGTILGAIEEDDDQRVPVSPAQQMEIQK